MMVDKELLNKKLQELDRYVNQLKKHQGVSPEQLKNDLDLAWIIQHGLQLCIQVVLDIGNHILADSGNSINEYADIFPELAKLNVIPENYASSIKGMTGLRNLLVHEYSEIDMEKISEILNDRLKDFNDFAEFVINYIED